MELSNLFCLSIPCSWAQWFCHVDDDVYVNVEQFKRLLLHYDPVKPYYVGRHWRAALGRTVRSCCTCVHIYLHVRIHTHTCTSYNTSKSALADI